MHMWIVFALVCLTFAGCATPETGAVDPSPDDVSPEPGAEALRPVLFSGPPSFVKERWDNGTFQPQENRLPTGLAVSIATGARPYERWFDISGDIPPGVPVNVSIVADAGMRGGSWPTGGNIWLLIVCDEQDYVTSVVFQGGAAHREVVAYVQALTGRPIQVLLRYNQVDLSTQVDFSVHTTIRAVDGILPPGAPASITLDAGTQLRFVPEGARGRVTLWDPQNRVLAQPSLEGPYLLNVTEPGSYLILNHQPGAPVRVEATQDAALGLVALRWVPGSNARPLQDAPQSWNSAPSGPIMTAGILVESADGPFVCGGFSVSMATEKGEPIFTMSTPGETCAGAAPLLGEGWFGQATVGGPLLLAKGFTIHAENRGGVGFQAQEWYRQFVGRGVDA